VNRYRRYGIRVLVWVVGGIILLWIGIWIFISLNIGTLKQQIVERIQRRTKGDVVVGKISPDFFNTFPFISIDIADITIRDSLYQTHKHDFFTAKHVFLRISPISLLSKSKIGTVIARSGSVYLFTDSSGYSNRYILKSGDSASTPADKSSLATYPNIQLEQMVITFENQERFKLYKATINKAVCKIKDRDSGVDVRVKADMTVNNLAFNTMQGSYMENKSFEGNFSLVYDKATKTISFNNLLLRLDKQPLRFTGAFSLNKANPDFSLRIYGRNLNYSRAAGLLPAKIRVVMDQYKLDKPVNVDVNIAGSTKFRTIPKVSAKMQVTDNNLSTPFGEFSHCSFDAEYINEIDSSKPRLDENSSITFQLFSATWNKIPLKSKKIIITNLITPVLETELTTIAELKSVNNLTESNTLKFTGGTCAVDVVFKGPVVESDSLETNINGSIELKDAAFKYLPRNISFNDGKGTLRFNGKDIEVNKLDIRTGSTTLVMNGEAKNFLSLLNISPEKMSLQWKVSSPNLHLADFKGFLSKSAASHNKADSVALFKKATSKIDKMFTDGDVHLVLTAPKVNYKKFNASNLQADVLLTSTTVNLQKAFLEHANGSMNIHGVMRDAGKQNQVELKTEMSKMDIPALFNAFGDFGQDAVTSRNLSGKLSAFIDLKTIITDQADIQQNNTTGVVDFLLENGELNHFEPLLKMSDIMKKQDFSEIKFADLKNRLEINGTAFIINKMEIRSTAFTMFVEGIYDVKKGTDLSIQVPVRNLTKSQAGTDLSDSGKKGAGINVRLRARTGDDGKLKVSWDPFKKALKNKKEVTDSLEQK
jgi:hypothetical protein